MYRASEIARVFEEIAPKESGIAGDELGFVYGSPEVEVHGLACLWNIHVESLKACIEKSANMVICHESVWMPEHTSDWYQGPEKNDIYSNRVRKQLLDQHQIVVYRSHSNWDALERFGVADQAVSALGIEGLQTKARQKFFSVQELPREMSVDELAKHAKIGLEFEFCRIFGDRRKTIRKFAFLIGGFGENQWNIAQAAQEMGAESVIIGEMSEFIVIAALEMGMPVIESLHSISEIPAIKRQAAMLAQKFPDLPVHYIQSGAMAFDPNLRGLA
ncbi:MAG: Nif3-like dinuclear metal center hexameric protein [Pirellulales bacterium]|nr:Nif3-like dinuclear metal center hexameric protein [Pirellulales bacterium]